MSTRTYANCEFGMILVGDDIEYFKKKYIEKNPREFTPDKAKSYEDHDDMVEEWLCCNEGFTDADYTGDPDENEDQYFYAHYLGENTNCEGVTFYGTIKGGSEEIDYRDLPVVFIEASKPCSARCVLTRGFYKYFDEVLEEFKAKVGGYLPEDFKYDEAIGEVLYAVYC